MFYILEMIASEEEMDAAGVQPFERDFCAHLLIEMRKCRDKETPFYYRCNHEKHTYLQCQYDE